jgi:hypothetical protein
LKKSAFIFFLPFAIISLIDIVFKLGFDQVLALNPLMIQSHSEVWRIFTFPLIDSSIISIFILGIAILYFIPQLTQYFTKFHLATLLLLLLLLQGAMQFLIFWGRDISFGGFTSIASFILVLTATIYPRAKFSLSSNLKLNNLHIILLLFLIYFTSGIEKMWTGDSSEAIAFLFPIFLGIGTAFSVVVQIFIFKKYFLPKRQARSFAEIAELLTHARESMRKLETSLVDETVGATGHQTDKRGQYSLDLSDDPEENENNLNYILDKIIDHGQDSLTNEEAQFLQKFSRNL